jgi:hypothetical protein
MKAAFTERCRACENSAARKSSKSLLDFLQQPIGVIPPTPFATERGHMLRLFSASSGEDRFWADNRVVVFCALVEEMPPNLSTKS